MMSEEKETSAGEKKESDGRYTSRPLYAAYALMLVFSAAVLLIGIYLGNFLEVFIAVPVILILADALFTERTRVHIPPLMIFITMGMMVLVLLGRFFGGEYPASIFVDYLFGAVMGLGGLAAAYSLANTVPDAGRERPVRLIFVSLSVSLSVFALLLMLQYYLGLALGVQTQTSDRMMEQLLLVTLGTLTVSGAFYVCRHSVPVRRAAARYMENSAATLDIDEYERMEIEKALKSGESAKVEFKSTLRTNLETGEKDPRMEKAVLKTLVAFLNSSGGTLLIGIRDDGAVTGIDEQSFESRDKLNLHLTNLIASQIGNEFLPFISFRLSDHDGKGVMRIVCRKSGSPVFLKEGKRETFFVRSGPSSVELHGMDTLNYVDNRFRRRRRRRRSKRKKMFEE